MLMMKYDVGSAVLLVIMQFTRCVVSDIADPVATRIISSIKSSMMQLFASQQVNLDANFAYNDCIYVTASITDGIVTCSLDEGDGVAIINLTMHECSALIATYNSIN